MEDVLKNVVPQASILTEENSATDSNRVKAPVVGAGSTNFGGSQKHDVANQADAEGVDHLALTASQKTSEKQEVGQASKEATAMLALRTKVESLVDFILGQKNIHTELKNMTRSTNRALAELIKVRQIPKPEKRNRQTGKTMQEKSKREGTTPPETPRQKKPIETKEETKFLITRRR